MSPRAAANAARSTDEKQANQADDHDESKLSEGIEGLVRASDATAGQKLARAIEEGVWRTFRFWQRSGSLGKVRYWYIGRTIDAAIHDDGSVEVRNKAGVTLTPVAYQTVQSSQPVGASTSGQSAASGSPTGVGGGLSVTDPGRVLTRMVTGKPQDNAEARRFLSDTRALREQLMNADAHKKEQKALKRLRAQLTKLWNQPGPPGPKAERTFALWDECADDALGQSGQRQIEAFLGKLQAARGACPYDATELARLNVARTSARPFAPCTEAPDAGTPH